MDHRLERAPVEMQRLQESAARAGTEWALSLMLSWYPDVKVTQLTAGFRRGGEFAKLHLLPGVHDTACLVSQWFDLYEFVPRPSRQEDASDDEVEGDDDLAVFNNEPADLVGKGTGVDGAGCSDAPQADDKRKGVAE